MLCPRRSLGCWPEPSHDPTLQIFLDSHHGHTHSPAQLMLPALPLPFSLPPPWVPGEQAPTALSPPSSQRWGAGWVAWKEGGVPASGETITHGNDCEDFAEPRAHIISSDPPTAFGQGGADQALRGWEAGSRDPRFWVCLTSGPRGSFSFLLAPQGQDSVPLTCQGSTFSLHIRSPLGEAQ